MLIYTQKNTILLAQIQSLSRSEKFEIMLFLAHELDKEEGIIDVNDSEIYLDKLRNSNEAAHQLRKLLEQKEQVQNTKFLKIYFLTNSRLLKPKTLIKSLIFCKKSEILD